MLAKEITPSKTVVISLPHGKDLLKTLMDIAEEHNIILGRVEAIGAVQNATIAYYHQDTRDYSARMINHPMELISCIGNISLREGKPIVHAHVSLADPQGNAFGGHLMIGTTIFSGEAFLTGYAGVALERYEDSTTGLPLWREQ